MLSNHDYSMGIAWMDRWMVVVIRTLFYWLIFFDLLLIVTVAFYSFRTY
jgi:hypothetical protein